MIAMDQKVVIRHAYYVERRAIREIARTMGLHRKTVRNALRDAAPPQYTLKAPRFCPVLGTHKPLIREILRKDREAPRKQRHSARRIWERLVQEHGFLGAESTVREYVRECKRDLGVGRPEVYIPIDHPPNGRAQADWGDVQILLRHQPTTIQMFAMRLSHSGKLFVKAYPTQRQEAVADAHDAAFRFFGGVPPMIDYDNPKTLVKKILRGHRRVEQEFFLAIKSHYLFDAHFCTPRAPHEKGGVENAIGYVKRHFFCPLPEVETLEDLNAVLLAQCRDQDRRTPAGRIETIGEAFDRERGALGGLPSFAFDCCRGVEARVSSLSQVTFEGNRYSVPVRYAYQPVTVKVYVDHIRIVRCQETIARHERCYRRGEELFDPTHYLAALSTKPGALEHGKPFRHWALPEIFERFRKTVSTTVYIRILQEIANRGVEKVREVLQEAIARGMTGTDEILRLMENGCAIDRMDLAGRPDLAEISVAPTPLVAYDALIRQG